MDVFALSVKFQAQGQKEVEAALEKVGKKLEMTQRVGIAAGAVLAAGIAGTMALIVKNSMEAENAMSQLNATIRSTGGAAGFSATEIAEMASDLQNVTAYGDDAIVAMQAVLMTFTKVRGDEFRGATQAILDMATALQMDLKGAALQVGKALNDPIAGVSALSRAGVQFSDAQKQVIAQLAETGRTAEAQRIILKELETQFGGSAVAARATLAGALKALGNAFGNLFEKQGVADGLRVAIESITQNINTLARVAVVAAALLAVQFFTPMVAGFMAVTQGITLATLAVKAFNVASALMGGPAGIAIRLGILALGAAWIKMSADADAANESIKKANAELAKTQRSARHDGRLLPNTEQLTAEQAQAIEAARLRLAQAQGNTVLALQLQLQQELNKAISNEERALIRSAYAYSIREAQQKAADDALQASGPEELGAGEPLDRWMSNLRPIGLPPLNVNMAEMPDVQPITDEYARIFAQLASDLANDPAWQAAQQIGATFVDSIANGIQAAVASGSIANGFAALKNTLLSGLGDAVMSFGINALKTSVLMERLYIALGNFLPGGAVAASIAMIALGAAMKGAAARSFGGMGGGGSSGGMGMSTFGGGVSDTFTRIQFGETNAGRAAGVAPLAPVNVTVIGPNDPVAQRQMQELIAKGARR